MAYCAVKRDSNRNIQKVIKEDGTESQLFVSIAKHPLVKTTEDALTLFKNKFANKIKPVVKGNRLFSTPLKDASNIADEYQKSLGKPTISLNKITKLDKDKSKSISDLFAKLESNSDPITIQAYQQMVEETIAQYELIVARGYQVELSNQEAYKSSTDMISDLIDNKRMKVLSTVYEFGNREINEQERLSNPLLRSTKFKDKNGKPLLANDIFRFVHDFFGHAKLGNGFGPLGEENAWNVHVRMYSPLASRAMTTETRGQNSWVNFSGVNKEAFDLRDKARNLRREGKVEEANALTQQVYELMKFADQKIGLLPEWVSEYQENLQDTTELINVSTDINEANISLTHRVNNQIYPSYSTALRAAQEGDTIEVGFEIANTFYPIVETKKNTNKNTEQGYINSMIESGYLSQDKVKSKAEYIYQAAGYSELYKSMTAQVINDDARAYLGSTGVVKDGFTFKLNKTTGKTKVTDKAGNLVEAAQAELYTMSYDQLEQKYGRETALNTITEREYQSTRQAYRDINLNLNDAEPAVEEAQTQLNLLNLLNKLGVRTMSISEYVKKYKMRNGVDPSAKALADIANQVVAYTEGNLNEIAEETAHFINEALPQDQVANVLRNIHHTQEWTEFSEVYREIYSKEYSAEMVDEAVRREVLGKIVAKVLKGETTNQTEIQKNIFERVFETVMDFFRNIANIMGRNTNVKQELEIYLRDVQKLMSQDDITDMVNTDNFKYNTFRFYSVGNSTDPIDRLRVRSLALVEQLMDSEKAYMKSGQGRRTNVKELEKIQNELQTATEVNSIASLVSMLNSNVKTLEAAIKDSERKNKPYFLSDEENILYQFVKGVGKKGIAQVQELVDKVRENDKLPEWKAISKELENTSSKITNLEAKADLIDSRNVERLVENILNKHNIAESDRPLVRKWIETAEADTNLFHATFGQLVHAKDGLLNLGGTIIRKMGNEANAELYEATKKFQNRLAELGLSEKDLGKNLTEGQYILSEIDYNTFNAKLDEIFAVSYKKTTGKAISETQSKVNALENNTNRTEVETNQLELLKERLKAYTSYQTMEITDLVKLKSNNELHPLTLEEETNRKNIERPLKTPEIERTMKDSYYKEYEDNLKTAGVSPTTQQKLSNILGDLSSLKKKAFRKIGDRLVLDYNSLSESDLIMLSKLQRDRKALKSYTDNLGNLKPGLEYDVDSNGAVKLDTNKKPVVIIADRSLMTDDSLAAWDINNLDSLMANKFETQDAKLFYQVLDQIDQEQGRESALRFLELNSFMSFNDEFWKSLGSTEGVVDRLDKLVPDNASERREINRLKNNIITATFEMKNILKTYNKKGNPAEINVDLMTPQSKSLVLELKENIKTSVTQARMLTKQLEEEVNELEEPALGTSDVNEAYRAELMGGEIMEEPTDSPEISLLKAMEEVTFSREHTTPSDYKLITDIQYSITRYLSDGSDVSKSVHKILDDNRLNVEDLQDQNLHAMVLRTAVRQRLAPYYKRYTSKGYTAFTENLRKAPVLSEALKGSEAKTAMIEVNPNYSFFDTQSNDKLNEDYDNTFEGGYLQPKKGKYESQKFKDTFGQIVDNNGVKTSTKNPKLYQGYLAALEYNRVALEAQNIPETHNKFMLPQVRQSTIQRLKTFTSGNIGQNIRNFTKDALNFTEDDMIQGETMYGNDVKVIPKMYVRPLENPEDVSTELFYSLTLRAKEAYKRKAKVKYYGDLMSIHDKILTRDMNGKDPRASSTYKMFKSALDYNMFGIKETVTYPINTPFGTFDLTKLARHVLSFVKFRNLGLNAVIPITSLLTGAVTRKIEAFVGEFVDTRSQALGAREFTRISADGMKEMGVVNTKSKLNVLGQFFKSFDLNESFKNSDYGYLLRNMPRFAMFLHSAANYPLYGKILLGILHDFRIVDGQVMNKTKFMRIQASTTKQEKQSAETKWKSHEGDVIYKYIVQKDNAVEFDKQALSKTLMEGGLPLTEEALIAKISEIQNDIQGNVQYVNSIIDGQIPEDDKVMAQRHYLLSYLMTHRGWLSINAARRFKNRHLNLDTGVEEEGSYRSFFNYLGDVAREFKDGNKKTLIANFKKAWDSGDETTRRNIKRVGIEMAVVNTIMLLAIGLRAAAEDDDNEDLFALQLSNYLLFRTINELSSTQLNIVTNFSDTVESPLVAWDTMKNIFNVGQVFSGEEVKYGNYKGMTERSRYLTKMVPGMKQVFDLQNMNQTYNTYKFYNKSNFSLTPANLLWERTIDAPEE